jgi:hypothetical protein
LAALARAATRAACKWLPLGLLALLLGACGLTAPRGDAGFADLDSPGVFDTERVLALSIGPALLKFAAGHMDEDPEIQALLRGLEGVRVRVYEIDGDGERVARRMRRMSQDLEAKGWEPVVLVQDEGGQMRMLVKPGDEAIEGLLLIASDGTEEAVLVNLMGDLQPRYFSAVMVALDVDAPRVEVASSD